MINSICIIGYGAMGQLLENIFLQYLSKNQISIFDPHCDPAQVKSKFINDQQLAESDLLILSIPSSSYVEVCNKLSEINFKPQTIIVSIAAVMESAANAFQCLKDKNLNLILSHPLFGPASYEQNDAQIKGLKLAVHNFECDKETYSQIERILKSSEVDTINVTPAEHDQQMALNHFVPYFLSHALKRNSFPTSNLLTHSGEKLLDFSNSSSENMGVLRDIYQENSYAKDFLEQFFNSQKILQGELE